jgi:thioredoxin reductase
MDPRGNIVVDEFMESSVGGIYAAGDIASFPLNLPTTQGIHSSRNLTGFLE